MEAALPLFIKDGFHKTTTRQIAKAAKVSVGSMYEYVASKEDILYLACLSIHDQVEQGVSNALSKQSGGRAALKEVVKEFFMVCHRMSDEILLMYQLTKSLPEQWQKKVLTNDIRISTLLQDAITSGRSDGGLVRLVTPIAAGEDEAAADARLDDMLRELVPLLPAYFPPT